MKTVGIIGGLGPETTAKFYLELIFKTYKLNSGERPPVLLWSVPIGYQIESDFINGEDRSSEYITLLIDAAHRLEAGGADFIVIPCNSVHTFIEEVRRAVSIPVLSIVEETQTFLHLKQISNIGLLATTASLQARLYHNVLEQSGVQIVTPSENDQNKMGEIINKLVRDEYSDEQKTELLEIISRFSDQKIATVLLACTDLQLLAPKFDGITIYDTMEILLDATVRELLA